jgi:hypothetical protein
MSFACVAARIAICLPNSNVQLLVESFLDAADAPQDALAMFQPGPDWSGPPMAVLLNKADQLEEQQLQELTAWYKQNCRAEQVGQTLVKLQPNMTVSLAADIFFCSRPAALRGA